MKKIVILLAYFLLSVVLSYGQSMKRITLEFHLEDFEFQQDDAGCLVIFPRNYNYFFKSDTLQPALPLFAFNVLVGSTESYSSHSVSESKTLVRDNVVLAHNPEAFPTNVQAPLPVNRTMPSYTQETYPNVIVEYAGTNDGGGYKLLSFHVCPFEYDVQNRQLFLKPQIIINIQMDNDTLRSSATMQGQQGVLNNQHIRKVVINPEDVKDDAMNVRNTKSNAELTLQTGYEYVIITSNQMKSAFQPLAEWKSRKGIRAKVLAVEDIYPVYNGSSKPEKIKRALSQIDGLKYVLLGGDTLNVPTVMCFIGDHQTAARITPADTYYACLGTMNWDADEDDLYGEISDNVNLLPSLNVSRAPVATIEDAQTFVNRIINYESAPDTTNWEDNILMGGKSLGYKVDHQHYDYYFYNYYTTGDSVSDTQHWSQTIYDTYINPSNPSYPSWDGDRVRLYDTHSDVSVSGNYNFTYSSLQTEMSKGYTFVDIMTHGGIYAWTVEGDSYYEWGHANRLNNTGYTIVTTTACSTNAFDFNTTYHNHGLWCLSQHFIQNPNSGILAYWGTSRENWYYPMIRNITLGAVFDGLTYQKLLEDSYHRMGTAATGVKLETMPSASEGYNEKRRIWMALNLMGDPEMPVYMSKPKTFQNVSIEFVNDSVYVDTGIDGFDICFINQTDSTDYYIARNIESSSVSFGGLDGIYNVCISKPGYIPYTSVCGDLYLQNITITGSKTYTANSVIIGSNVTDKVYQGPVTVSSGTTTIKASEGSTITRDFEVEQGAQFIITNQ